MKSLFLLIFFLLNFLLFAVEFVPDGDFEQVSCPDFRAFGNLVSIVETSYGRSLLLGKYSGINDVKHLSGQELPLKLKSRRDGRPYYSFQLKLNPETNYDLRFDYMPLNMSIGGFCLITDRKGKMLYSRELTVDNTDWNPFILPFRSSKDGIVNVMLMLKRRAETAGMVLDHISVRPAGNILPRWGESTVLNDSSFRWIYLLKTEEGDAVIHSDSRGFTAESSGPAKCLLYFKTPSVVPEKQYILGLKGESSGNASMKIRFRMLGADLKPVAEPVVVNREIFSGKPFVIREKISLPPDIVLLDVQTEFFLKESSTLKVDAPFIYESQSVEKKH
ncbi:MAG: hypothetical protein J6M38_07815 [Lentisphaeria bacterium]|nr:hypothetical protein [Lentisphaeria bacterium]